MWENFNVTKMFRFTRIAIVLSVVSAYLALIYFVMDRARLFFLVTRFDYAFLNSCFDIHNQFAGNTTDYHHWAKIDMEYVNSG